MLDLPAYLQAQAREACAGFNRWVTGVAVKHDPTPSECVSHWAINGGPEEFARRRRHEFERPDPPQS